MALTKKQFENLHQVVSEFTAKNCKFRLGFQLNTITKALAEVLGETKICINVPYSTFNCRGTAKAVAEDVQGLMPFSNFRKEENECTTLFYGNSPITKSNYIPFQSSADCYHIERMEICKDVINFWLIKGNSYHMLM